MKIISFAWTTPALLARRKTVTRRDWVDHHAALFHKGDLIAAYNRQPRFGGHLVATIRLTADAYKESTAKAPPEDFEKEGFAYLDERRLMVAGDTPLEVWESWHESPSDWWVIRFEVVEVVGQCDEGHVWKEIRPKGHPICVRCGTLKPGWVDAEPQLALPMEAT